MSKQDRQGIRSPADLERKYDLASIVGLKKAVKNSEEGLNKVDSILHSFVLSTIGTIGNLREQIDSNITTWFYSGIPTLSSLPASEWNTDDIMYTHWGDLYYDQSAGNAYRFVANRNEYNVEYSWELINDRAVAESLAIADSMSDAVDNKRRIFVKQPVPPYDNGDLWLKEKEVFICQVTKETNEYEDDDFIIATDYTEGTMAKKMGDVLQILKGSVTTIRKNVDSVESVVTSLVNDVAEAESSIKQTAEGLQSKVSKGEIVSEINQSAEEVKIKGEKISLEGTVTANDRFKILEDGSMRCMDGYFEGSITSNSANITGGTISIETDGSSHSAIGLYWETVATSIYPGTIYMSYYADEIDDTGTTEISPGYMAINSGRHTLLGVSAVQVVVDTAFKVYGTKERVAKTQSYSERSLYCYEMPSPIFGDVGHGIVGEDGLCYVDIDQIFFETVDMNQSYQVFLQSYSENSVHIWERQPQYFVVKGIPGTEFDWELKAKQLDFPMHRLEEQDKDDFEEVDYVDSAATYLKTYEQEVLDYEH